MSFDFTGKIAVVTGASSGIGKQTALQLAEGGADVAILYVGSKDGADEAVEKITAMGRKAVAYECNVADAEATKNTVDAIHKEFGRIDILVNNAGITRDNLILKMKEEDWDAVLNVNLKGAFNMIKATYRIFSRQRSGRIISISSASGIMGNAGQANYSASKAGIIGLTKSVARELAVRNVTCNAVAPGFVETPMTAGFDDSNPLVASIPLKRMGQPKDIANAVCFLASDEAEYITGVVLSVDGGIAM
jgi:3-oxoacyl-[acyl-carrier protein] reductase